VAASAVQGAKSYGYNDFKIELAKRSVVRALAVAAGRREV
jgi:xanthine dehydrogenase YagS FAD-binding subunit